MQSATLVERHSRYAMLIKVPGKDTEVRTRGATWNPNAGADLSCSWRATWEGVHRLDHLGRKLPAKLLILMLTRESKCKPIWPVIFN